MTITDRTRQQGCCLLRNSKPAALYSACTPLKGEMGEMGETGEVFASAHGYDLATVQMRLKWAIMPTFHILPQRCSRFALQMLAFVLFVPRLCCLTGHGTEIYTRILRSPWLQGVVASADLLVSPHKRQMPGMLSA